MTLRILCAISAIGTFMAFTASPTNRLRIVTGAFGCLAWASMAIYSHRTRRSRMLAAFLLLVFVALAMVLLRRHDLFNH
ncbi:MAG: hypothetical protein J0H27_10020 [Xanthomonadales bacterium]|nr:hypothetical protein [Xanthomonadales bacterium]OJY82244.1 MAG: hypothetical protein BGP23_01650 [Xanthomonadales bacterium 66-474]